VLDTTLADNGGPTLTHALLDPSPDTTNPAINAGNADATPADQRGAPAVNTRDIGAYEFNGTVPTVSFTVDETTLTEGGAITQATVTITVTNFNTAFEVSFAFTGDVTGDDYSTNYAGPYTISGDGDTMFMIDIVNDALTEGTETLTLEMFIIGTAGITGSNPQSITFLDTPPPAEPPPADDSPQPQPTQDASTLESVEELPQTGESPFWRNWLVALLVIGAGLATATGVVLRR
jgi:hypothetical protein